MERQITVAPTASEQELVEMVFTEDGEIMPG